jgi:hypothetical protein
VIEATVRRRSVSTSRSPDIRALLDDPNGPVGRKLQSYAAEATKEAKRLMEAELRYPRRPQDSPPGGKERRRREVHLIDTIRSTTVKKGPRGPFIQISAHPAFRYLESGTKPHMIDSPGHPQSSFTRTQWSVKWQPPVWHRDGGEHMGPGSAWVDQVPHPGTAAHHFLRRAVRHALNAS